MIIFLNSFYVMWPTMMIKNFSNAQEVNIFSSRNVSFYTILSHVLDSDSEIPKMNFFFQKSNQ